MDGANFQEIDFAAYLFGMFFSGGFMMAAYGVFAAIKSVKGSEIPVAIVALMLGYLWWSGENINPLTYFF